MSFLTEIPSFFNIEFPLDYPLIAGCYSNVDTRGPESGTVWYRKTSDPATLSRISSEIRNNFEDRNNFQALEVFIVTWDSVGYFERKSDLTNTFQIIIASNNEDSFVIFYYPENEINWLKGEGKSKNIPDARAQAGIISGEGRHIVLPSSGSDQMRNLDK